MKEEKGREWNKMGGREGEKGRKAEIIKLQMNILREKEDTERDREDREKVIISS